MKILLAVLLCLVLCTSESFAIKGGPVYPVGTNIVGSYAGVLQGVFDPTDFGASQNSVGVFSLGVPSTGLATGAFVMFSRGRVFTGTVNAHADPRNASFTGILDASFDFTVRVPDVVLSDGSMSFITDTRTATANGPITATASSPKSGSVSGSTTTILRGTAVLTVTQDTSPQGNKPTSTAFSLVVSGVKQSDSPPSSPGLG